MVMAAELVLDVCTPEGKTWLARVLRRDVSQPGNLARVFIRVDEYNLSGSRKTGNVTYTELSDGVYESNEGRRRLGRRYWVVTGDEIREVDRKEAMAALVQS